MKRQDALDYARRHPADADTGITRRQLGRGGHDVTRLAAASPKVWTAVALDNAPAIEYLPQVATGVSNSLYGVAFRHGV